MKLVKLLNENISLKYTLDIDEMLTTEQIKMLEMNPNQFDMFTWIVDRNKRVFIDGDIEEAKEINRAIAKKLIEIHMRAHTDRNGNLKVLVWEDLNTREKRIMRAIWRRMKNRIAHSNNPNDKYYEGMWMDPDWGNFECYKAWALSRGYLPGLSIDRIDNGKGYGPDNCRFVSYEIQNSNKTNSKAVIMPDGTAWSLAVLHLTTGLSLPTLRYRLKYGCSLDRLFGDVNLTTSTGRVHHKNEGTAA